MCKDLQRLVLAASSLLMGGLVSAQVNDPFDDGDFILNPTWSGSDALFTVATGQLRSNSPGAANYYLSTPSTQATNAQWDYFINLKFSTSGANYADVYLMSSAADLQSGVNGYFVRMGGTTDRIELFRSDAGVNTSLIVSPDGIVNSSTNNPFRIEVKRQADNTWTLLYDDGALGTFSTAGQTVDATYTSCTHFGSRIEQSTLAGAVNNHYFDDFAVGPLLLDITPPSILSATIISSTEIDVLFSETVEQTTAEDENNYNITPFNSAAAVVRDVTDLALVHVTLSLAMQNGNTYTIAVNGVEDLAANPCMNETADVEYVISDIAVPGDVIINELMADPTPTVGLPDAEFIEIFNTTTNKTFDLANWTISDGSSSGTLPNVQLAPGAYAILTSAANAALFTGFGAVVIASTLPSLNNAGDPLELANGDATVIDAVSYVLSWYNDAQKALGGWSLERIDPTTPCSTASNWTASNDVQGGTPGEQNSVFNIIPDVTAPSLLTVSVNTNTELELLFSESMNSNSLTTASYVLSPPIGVILAQSLGDDRVLLTLASPLVLDQSYTITITGVSDCVGNAAPVLISEFLFFVADVASPGDVIINELMADPSPTVGLPEAEYIELFNTTTDKTFDLANWTISDGSGIGLLTSVPLPPGAYVILTDDASAALFTGFGTVVGLSTFPSLNNDGDPLELANENSSSIDVVNYALGWYNDAEKALGGWSLERIDPTTPCSGSTNWTASNSAQGGTPGAENSVFAIVPDVTAPLLSSVVIISDTQLELVFNETMDLGSLFGANYTLNPPIGVSFVQPTGDARVLLTLATALTLDQSYTITVTGVSDCVGNVAAALTRNFLYFIPDIPTFRSVVINEIFPDPSPQIGLPGVEFVEVFNASTDQIYDLGGWTFGDAGSQTVLPSVILGPGQYGVIMDDADTTAFFFVNRKIPVGSFPSLNNDSDSLKLRDPNGVLIDEANYTLDWYQDVAKADGGWTMEQKDPFTPCSSVNNWRASTASNGGTPGTQNSAYDLTPDTQAPALTNVFVNSSTVIQLVFDEPMNAASLSIGVYTFDPVLTVTQVDVIDPTNVQLSLGQSLPVGQLYVITVVGVSDCPGNLIGNTNTFTFALPEPALAGDVVINEVLYDPRGSGSDFVELYNRSNKVLSLGNWDLANETDGIIDNATPITTTAQLLLPGQYALISESSANIASEYPLSRTDRFIETGLPSYNNGAGVVVLQDPVGNVLDRFAYDDALHFELLNSTDGVSLERVDPNRPTDEFTNWHSAAQSVGYATPGYKNSQYSETPDPSGELTIDPKIFSPDNDGYQDLLTLAYRLNEPGFTGTMIVFDVAGREVIKLMDNELLGTSGAVSWNGIMETGDLARMGPYVVYFEAFDLSGNVEKFRETVVLAHKLN